MRPRFQYLPGPEPRVTNSETPVLLWEVEFTQTEIVGDVAFQLVANIFMQNAAGSTATTMGAILTVRLDGDLLLGQAATELAVDVETAPGILTMTDCVTLQVLARDVTAGGHALEVYWQVTDDDCEAAVAPGEASVLILGVAS